MRNKAPTRKNQAQTHTDQRKHWVHGGLRVSVNRRHASNAIRRVVTDFKLERYGQAVGFVMWFFNRLSFNESGVELTECRWDSNESLCEAIGTDEMVVKAFLRRLCQSEVIERKRYGQTQRCYAFSKKMIIWVQTRARQIGFKHSISKVEFTNREDPYSHISVPFWCNQCAKKGLFVGILANFESVGVVDNQPQKSKRPKSDKADVSLEVVDNQPQTSLEVVDDQPQKDSGGSRELPPETKREISGGSRELPPGRSGGSRELPAGASGGSRQLPQSLRIKSLGIKRVEEEEEEIKNEPPSSSNSAPPDSESVQNAGSGNVVPITRNARHLEKTEFWAEMQNAKEIRKASDLRRSQARMDSGQLPSAVSNPMPKAVPQVESNAVLKLADLAPEQLEQYRRLIDRLITKDQRHRLPGDLKERVYQTSLKLAVSECYESAMEDLRIQLDEDGCLNIHEALSVYSKNHLNGNVGKAWNMFLQTLEGKHLKKK